MPPSKSKTKQWTKTKEWSGHGRICENCQKDCPTSSKHKDLYTGKYALMDDSPHTAGLFHVYVCSAKLTAEDININRFKFIDNQEQFASEGRRIKAETGYYPQAGEIIENLKQKGLWHDLSEFITNSNSPLAEYQRKKVVEDLNQQILMTRGQIQEMLKFIEQTMTTAADLLLMLRQKLDFIDSVTPVGGKGV